MAPLFSTVFAFSLLFIGVFVHAHKHQELVSAFTYGGSQGPQNWGHLNPNFKACSNGKIQSPVDIVKGKAVYSKNLQPLIRRYSSSNATLVNNGFNIGIRFEGDAGGVGIDGKNFRLKQMHWHAPSEHRLDGEQFAAELHLVHQEDGGTYTVVSILLRYGDPDPLIAKIEDKLEELGKEISKGNQAHIALGKLDTQNLKKKTRKYYRYVGSLTTPPCSEDVVWNILGKVRTISKKQVEALKAPLPMTCKSNARPPQPLNGRQVLLYDELSEH